MGAKTNIAWTDATWNPTTGCSHVSAGCSGCYAERMAPRLHAMGQTDAYTTLPWTAQNAKENVFLHPDRLQLPMSWKKPKRIFVNSMSDVFHERIPVEFIVKIFQTMANCPQHIFQILTKRPERMQKILSDESFWQQIPHVLGKPPVMNARGFYYKPECYNPMDFKALKNVHLGTSAEDERWYQERWPYVVNTPAFVRWLSLEPLLGPIELSIGRFNQIDWVVVGGESGPRARPMNPAWARALRDECQMRRIPFHFKQWGEWAPMSEEREGYIRAEAPDDMVDRVIFPNGAHMFVIINGNNGIDATLIHRYGKMAAGRELDGRTWDEWPDMAHIR